MQVVLAADGRACIDHTSADPLATVTAGTQEYLTAQAVQQQRELLLVRWKCLLEDKAQLTAMMRMAAGKVILPYLLRLL
jgi:hypothetical protein